MKNEVRNISTFILLTSSFILSSCGFQPVYGTGDGNVASKLAAVRVEKVEGREGQILQTNLKELLNPANANPAEVAYSLHMHLKNSRREVGINKDLRVTRYDVIPNVDYELVDLNTNKTVDTGHVAIKSSYNRAASEFATYVAEEDAAEKGDQEAAEEIRSRLISFFSNK